MKNKFTCSLFSTLLLFLFACKKSDTAGPTGTLQTSRSAIRLDTAAGTYDTLTVQSTVPWTATLSSGASGWLQLDKTSGAGGNSVIKLTALTNNGSATQQTATVTFTAVNNSAIPAVAITVTQKPFTVSLGWQKTFGGTSNDVALASSKTPDGGTILAGYSASTDGDVTGNHGSLDFWVVKLDASGTKQWQKSLGGTGAEVANSIIVTPDGGYAVAGYSSSINGDVTGNHGNYDMWIVKLDGNGTIQWQKSLGGTSADVANSIIVTPDGGYAVAGYSNSIDGDVSGNHGGDDYWVVKLDATGTIQWQKTLGGAGYDVARSIIATSDGGYAVAGYSTSTDGDVTGNHGTADYWVVKLDASGTKQWQKALGGTGDDGASSMIATPDGGYAVAGYSNSTDGDVSVNHGSYDFWIVKLDASGTKQWQKTLGGTGDDEAYSIIASPDGGYAVAGYSKSNNGDVSGNHGGVDYWVVKLNGTGNKLWQKTLGGSSYDVARSIMATSDGGYAVAGFTYSTDGDVSGNHGSYDYWVVKLTVQ